MFIDIKSVIVFNRIGHGEDTFLWRRRSPSSSEFWSVFSCSCWRPLWVNMVLLRIWARVVWSWSYGFPLGYWWSHKCRNNSLSVVVVPIRLDVHGAWALLAFCTAGWCYHHPLPVPSGWAMGLMYQLCWKFTFTKIYCNLNLQGIFNIIEGGIKL